MWGASGKFKSQSLQLLLLKGWRIAFEICWAWSCLLWAVRLCGWLSMSEARSSSIEWKIQLRSRRTFAISRYIFVVLSYIHKMYIHRLHSKCIESTECEYFCLWNQRWKNSKNKNLYLQCRTWCIHTYLQNIINRAVQLRVISSLLNYYNNTN